MIVSKECLDLMEKLLIENGSELSTHPGVALLWVPTLGGARARPPGGFAFKERVRVRVIICEKSVYW